MMMRLCWNGMAFNRSGISPEELPHIFVSFSGADGTGFPDPPVSGSD
jgi:hypothetical protein